jgi:hypothetical protein
MPDPVTSPPVRYKLPTRLVAPWVNALGRVDDDALYWTENENQSVLQRVALAGGAPTVVPTADRCKTSRSTRAMCTSR